MNRRHKKPPQTDYLALVQNFWQRLDWPRYRQRLQELWLALPLRHRRSLMVLIPVVLGLMVIPLPEKSTALNAAPAAAQRIEVGINTQSLSEQGTPTPSELKSSAWQEYVVRQGDTLSQVFRINQLPLSDINELVKVEGADKPLSQIQAGQLIRFKLAENGQLDILQLERNSQSVMFFRLSDGGFGRSK
ncbi:MAG: LysM-like peptidoglycan-binding domain-containing protein [Vibrio sp.]